MISSVEIDESLTGTTNSSPQLFSTGVGAGKFLGVRRIFTRISPNLPKMFCVPFVYTFSPTMIMKTFFWYDLQRNDFHVFFCKRWVPFLK